MNLVVIGMEWEIHHLYPVQNFEFSPKPPGVGCTSSYEYTLLHT